MCKDDQMDCETQVQKKLKGRMEEKGLNKLTKTVKKKKKQNTNPLHINFLQSKISLHFSVLFQAYADLRLHHHQPGSTGKWEFKDFLQPKKTGKRYWGKSLIFGVNSPIPVTARQQHPVSYHRR